MCFQCALLVERGEDSLHEIMWDVSWASYLLGIWPLISGVLAGKAAGGYVIYIPDIMKVPEEVKEGITAELPELSCVTEWIKEENRR